MASPLKVEFQFDFGSPNAYLAEVAIAQHGGVPVAAITLAFACGLKPKAGALLRTMKWSWAYMAVICLFNWILSTNYGYFNGPPKVASLLDVMGPWPWYLLTLQGVAVLFFTILLLPFRRSMRRELKPVDTPLFTGEATSGFGTERGK